MAHYTLFKTGDDLTENTLWEEIGKYALSIESTYGGFRYYWGVVRPDVVENDEVFAALATADTLGTPADEVAKKKVGELALAATQSEEERAEAKAKAEHAAIAGPGVGTWGQIHMNVTKWRDNANKLPLDPNVRWRTPVTKPLSNLGNEGGIDEEQAQGEEANLGKRRPQGELPDYELPRFRSRPKAIYEYVMECRHGTSNMKAQGIDYGNKKFKFIRGHLVNAVLDGPDEKYNFYPISSETNSDHKHFDDAVMRLLPLEKKNPKVLYAERLQNIVYRVHAGIWSKRWMLGEGAAAEATAEAIADGSQGNDAQDDVYCRGFECTLAIQYDGQWLNREITAEQLRKIFLHLGQEDKQHLKYIIQMLKPGTVAELPNSLKHPTDG